MCSPAAAEPGTLRRPLCNPKPTPVRLPALSLPHGPHAELDHLRTARSGLLPVMSRSQALKHMFSISSWAAGGQQEGELEGIVDGGGPGSGVGAPEQ